MTGAPALVLRTRPPARCPADGTDLDGGPVAYWCAACGRGVHAADVDFSFHAAATSQYHEGAISGTRSAA
jgi:hypothetical protein